MRAGATTRETPPDPGIRAQSQVGFPLIHGSNDRSSDVVVAIRRIVNHVIRAIHQSQVQSNLVETGDAECVDIVSRVSHRNLARDDFHCRLGNFWAWWRKNNTSDYKQMERPAKVQERLAPTRPKTKNEKAE